jgi:hypothetical protein
MVGVPAAVGIGAAASRDEPAFLLIPLAAVAIVATVYVLSPVGVSVSADAIAIRKPVGEWRIALRRLREVRSPARHPPGLTLGLLRSSGLHGSFGIFWNRAWGRFRVYVTNHKNMVELVLDDGSRVLISPDDRRGFCAALREAAAAWGVPLEIVES